MIRGDLGIAKFVSALGVNRKLFHWEADDSLPERAFLYALREHFCAEPPGQTQTSKTVNITSYGGQAAGRDINN